MKSILKPRVIVPVLTALIFCSSCATVHLDETTPAEPEQKLDGIETLADEQEALARQEEQFRIEEELKEVDVEQTVIYIDRPVYSPVEPPPDSPPAGADAVQASTTSALQIPLKYINGAMFYPWDDTFVYEIHCQPYRTTDLILEPGEEVLEMPFLSEDKVWEIGAGVSRTNGLDVQHFFLKPSITALTTSMIIITNRRVYHLLLKSYGDRYMTMVQWEYPARFPFVVKPDAMNEQNRRINGVNTRAQDTLLVDPQFLSFDYKMTYSIFKKPLWLPRRIYDDGRKTYIELDERMLNMESPVLFNKKNERINYRVQQNLIIIDELIEKVTLRRGKEKITIVKKKYRGMRQEEGEQ
jgi:type IV secretion system protein VirB9